MAVTNVQHETLDREDVMSHTIVVRKPPGRQAWKMGDYIK